MEANRDPNGPPVGFSCGAQLRLARALPGRSGAVFRWPGCCLALLVACAPSQPPRAPAVTESPQQKAGELEPGKPEEGTLESATRAIEKGQWERAESSLNQAMAGGLDSAEAWYYLGVVRQARGNPEAVECFREALSRSADLVEAWVNLSAAHLDAQQFARALEAAEQGLSRFPQEPLLLENRALALARLDRPAQAATAYSQAVERSPGNEALRFAHAQALLDAGESGPARMRLEALVASNDPAVLASVARLLGKLKAYGPCIGALDKALGHQISAELLVRRGLCHHGLHDSQSTLADFQGAVEADSQFAPGHYYLGMHLKQSGQTDAARVSLQRAQALAGDEGVGRAAQRALEDLPAGK